VKEDKIFEEPVRKCKKNSLEIKTVEVIEVGRAFPNDRKN